jgi:hypothetical protein
VSDGYPGGQGTEPRRHERDHALDLSERAAVLAEALADSAAVTLHEHRSGQEPGHHCVYCSDLEAEVAASHSETAAGQQAEPAGTDVQEGAEPWPPRFLPGPVYAVSLDGEARQLPAGIETTWSTSPPPTTRWR